jgi:hypothetical protein
MTVATLALANNLSADVLRVPQAFPTIQAAISAANNGDTVLIAPGTYDGQLDFLGKVVRLQGAGEAVDVVLRSTSRLFNMTVDGSIPYYVADITFTGGVTDTLIQCSAGRPTFERCIFSANLRRALVDGRECASDTGSTFNDCLFIDNNEPNGGALYLSNANSQFNRCAFVRNTASGPTSGVNAGGAVYINDWNCGRHTFRFSDCWFAKNSAVWGGGIYSQGIYPASTTRLEIFGCTFWQNSASQGKAMWNWYITAPVLGSWLCGPDPIRHSWSDAGGNSFSATCDAEPPFADCDGDDIPDSLAVVLGIGEDCNGDGVLDSCQRPVGGSGADIDSNGVPDECQTVTVPFNFATIQAAIDAAPSNEMRIILVEPGAYVENIDFRGKPVRVRGVDENMTSLTGAPGVTKSVVTFSGGEPAIAALEHVRVTGGATGSPFPGAPQFQVGGGVFGYNSAASISHCIIEGNVASFGAGMYLWNSTGRVQFCSIRNNNAGADGGGALLFGGTLTMSDCSVVNNRANSRGGGLHLVSGVQLVERVDVSGNHSDNVVGGISWVPNENPAHFLRLVDVSVQNNTAAIVQGGIGVLQTDSSVRMSVQSSVACGNLPRPNVAGRWTDLGGNTICDCVGDLNVDGVVNGADLGLMLSSWGPCGTSCPYDLNTDGQINGADLGLVLSAWGACGG